MTILVTKRGGGACVLRCCGMDINNSAHWEGNFASTVTVHVPPLILLNLCEFSCGGAESREIASFYIVFCSCVLQFFFNIYSFESEKESMSRESQRV